MASALTLLVYFAFRLQPVVQRSSMLAAPAFVDFVRAFGNSYQSWSIARLDR